MEFRWENPDQYRHLAPTLVALVDEADCGAAVAMVDGCTMYLVTAPDGVQWNAWATKVEMPSPVGMPDRFARLTFTKTGPPPTIVKPGR
jgi:hypothetical protein